MSSQQGSPSKSSTVKRTPGKSGSSTPTKSPQKQYRHKRKRRNRTSSSSSDGIVHEVKRDLRHMERLLLHSGKLHVFRAYFDDPTLDFYTRPEGRRRHPAGAVNQQLPDENRAMAALGLQPGVDDRGAAAEHQDNNPLEKPLAVQVDEGPPSVMSSRGLSPGSSFATFPPSPPADCNADFEIVPFEGLPPISERPERVAAVAARSGRPQHRAASCSLAEQDDYMASASASESDEPVRNPNLEAIRVADRLDRMVVSSNPAPLPPPEPMSLSSDPATPQNSD